MNICILISTPFPPEEGIGNYVYGISTKLIEAGHEVTVITRGSWNKTQREAIDGIKVIKAPYIPIYPFYMHLHGIFVNKIFKSIESQIDVVHIHSPLSPLIKTSLPLITTIHTPMLMDERYVKITSIYSLFSKISAKFVSYPLELKLIQASDMVTTVTKSIAQELKEYHFDPEEVVVIGNGVDEKFFVPAQNMIEDDNKYIMYVGRMDREKGLFDLVECGEHMCNQRSDISFILAGRGRDLDKLKKKVRKLGLRDKFIFLGQVGKDKLVQLYQNATIFAFPSYHEGLPTALLEAMSCGLPIVATDVRGNRDLISSGEDGILVPPRSPKEMVDAISMLLDDEKMRRRLGKNARKTIEEHYTWDTVSNDILRCYESIKEVSKNDRLKSDY
jgi:glycosyltransferase involved in cell wall biosynthesis